jgi:hypothetical protein
VFCNGALPRVEPGGWLSQPYGVVYPCCQRRSVGLLTSLLAVKSCFGQSWQKWTYSARKLRLRPRNSATFDVYEISGA